MIKTSNSLKEKIIFTTVTIILVFFIVCVKIITPLVVCEANAKGSSSGYISIEKTSGQIVQQSNMHQRLEMASTTKIITAITVIENSNLDDIVKIDQRAVGVEGSSIYLKKDDEYTVRELLYGLMLRSGNDSAIALACHVSGDVQKFVVRMNELPKKLGLKNTCLKNPHGLTEKGHYTSCYDLAMITRHAMKNPVFSEIVSQKSVKIGSSERNNEQVLYNKNKLLNMMDTANGVKTGYTLSAGRCFVGSGKKDGVEIIAVVLNVHEMFEKSVELISYGYSQFECVNIAKKDDIVYECEVLGNSKTKAQLALCNDVNVVVRKGDKEKLVTKVEFKEKIIAPLFEREKIGEFCVYHDKQLLFSEKMYTINSVEVSDYYYILKKVAENYS